MERQKKESSDDALKTIDEELLKAVTTNQPDDVVDDVRRLLQLDISSLDIGPVRRGEDGMVISPDLSRVGLVSQLAADYVHALEAERVRALTSEIDEDGIGPLPLPQYLQEAVDQAPRTRVEVDAYFERVVEANWSDPLLRARARYVYFEELGSCPPIKGIPRDMLNEVSFFAAEMRVKRDVANVAPNRRLPFKRDLFNRVISEMDSTPPPELIERAHEWLTEDRHKPSKKPPSGELPIPEIARVVNTIVRKYLLAYYE